MRNEQWIFYENFSVFGQIEIYIKFRETEQEELFITASTRVWIHGSKRMHVYRDKSKIYNQQRIPPSNDKFIYGILRGTLDLAWV